MKDKRFLIFLLCLALAVSAQAYSPEYDQNGRLSFLKADLNRDGYFNMVDISLFASAWLEQDCGLSNPCSGADVYPHGGDSVIDLRDFAVTAEDYGRCTDPTNPDCLHVPLTLFEPPSASEYFIMSHTEPMGTWAHEFGPEVGLPSMYVQRSAPGGICATGRRYGALISPGGRIGGQIVVRRPPPHGVHNFLVRAYRPSGMDRETYVSALLGSSGDIFENAEGFEMAGNLVLTSEPDDPGLLGSSNSPYWSYGGSATGLSGGFGAPTDIWSIIQIILRDSYLQTNEDLKFYAEKVKSYNKLKKKMRDYISFMKKQKNKAKRKLRDWHKGTPGSSNVHLFSGEFTETVVDLHIPGRGPDFTWGRTYRSRLGPNTVSGNGWDFSYNIYIEQYGANLVLHNGTGRRDIYHPQPNGTWTAEGFFRELTQDDDLSFIVTFADKGTWKFHSFDEPNAPGKISAIIDRNGNSLSFEYDDSGRLTTIHDTLDTSEHNRDITIGYNTDGFIESVTDWTGRSVTYAYYNADEPNGSPGDLKSVTTPTVRGTPTGNDFPYGKTTTYTYSKGFADERLNHNLLTISDAKGQTYLRNIYGTNPDELSFDHVVRQIVGEGGDIIDITYMREVPDANNNYAVTRTVTNDRVGNVKEHFFSNRNELLIVREYTGRADANLPTSIDPNVNMPTGKLRSDDPTFFETRFQYNKDFLPTRTDYPNANNVTYVYESELEPDAPPRSRGNLREMHRFAGSLEAVSDQNEIVELFEYDTGFGGCGCGGTNFVTRYVNPLGNETLHDYDPNGNRIRTTYKRLSPDPNIIYEWQYNEFGQVTARVLPDNGSGHQRRDEYTYYTEEDRYQNGYLKNIVVDANNLALTAAYEYDDVGNVIRIIDPRGHDTQFIVNSLGQVVRSISRLVMDDSGVRYERDTYYDENDNIVRVDVQNKDEQGELQSNTYFTTAFEYDILNYLTRTTAEVDPLNSIITEYEYDNNRNLNLVRFGEATNGNQPKNVIRYLCDERGLVFQTVRAESEPNQSSTQYDYDGNGNLKKVSQGLEDTPYVSSFQYDGFSRLVEVRGPMGNVLEYDYDPAGNVAANRIEGELVDDPSNTNNVRLYESSYEYDTLNRPIHAEVSHFDPNTQSPIGDGNAVTQIFYSDNSQVTKVVDDRGNERRFQYDTANRRSVVTDAKDNAITYSYDENSNIIAGTEAEKSDLGSSDETFVTSYQYDNLDRLVRVIDNNDNTTEHAYDSRSNLTLRTDALNHQTRYTYDGLGRLITTVRDLDGDGPDGDGSDITTTQTWDDSSRLVGQTDDNSNITLYEWDPVVASRLYEYWFRASGAGWGRVSSGGWDRVSPTGWGRVSPVGWGRASPVGWGRASGAAWGRASGSGWGRMVKMTYADGTAVQYLYDVHDNITQTTDAAGSVVNSTYDLLGRLTAKTIAPGPGVSDDTTFENYKYDGVSRQVYAQDNDSNLTLICDSLSNVITETLNGKTTSSVYDGMGNRLSCTYPGGRVITCTFDELNRKKTISDANGLIASYDYIGPRRVERRSFRNNTQCDFAYDNVKRITSTKHSDSAGSIIDQRTYRWDEVYNKTQRKDVRTGGPQLTHDYSYDAVNRLIQTTVTNAISVVRGTDYSLDGVGNRTAVTGSPNPGTYTMYEITPEPADYQMNQYTTTPFDSRSYDKNGNLFTIDDGERTQKDIRYDYRNQMVEFTETSIGQVHRYRYDAFGRRIEKVTDSGGAPQTTRYFYGCWGVCEEQDDDDTTLATFVMYVYNNYHDEVLSMQCDANDYYYHHDELYNVMAVTDPCGLVIERYEYLDYGKPSFFDSSGGSIGGSAISNPYLFTGRRYDPETGLYYYRTRYLDPLAGRFTIRDKIGIWGDLGNLGNGTAYVGNRSPTDNDPSGRWGELCGGGI